MKINKLIFIFITFSFFIVLDINAEEQWTEDLSEIRKLAKEGDPYYQGVLGAIYRTGEFGIRKNYIFAERWIRMAYKVRHPIGTVQLAIMYDKGQRAKKNPKVAKRFYKMAFRGIRSLAKKNNPRAQEYLGEIYYYGKVTKPNYKQSEKWLAKAVSNNRISARDLLQKVRAKLGKEKKHIGILVNQAGFYCNGPRYPEGKICTVFEYRSSPEKKEEESAKENSES